MHNIICLLLFTGFLFSLSGCEKENAGLDHDINLPNEEIENKDIPKGYFEVVFSSPQSRVAVTGPDNRIRDLRYLLFSSTGAFVKEQRIVTPTNGTQTWPLAAVRDTLPIGSYRAVFLGNTEQTLFPYATSSNPVNYNPVLTGYKSGYSSGRIILPGAEFTDDTEYYMANVTFSNTSPNPSILLQRIIGMLNLHRNFVDAQTALNTLVNNIVTNVGYKNLIRSQVTNLLSGLIKDKLDLGIVGNAVYALLGGLDAVVNVLVGTLIEPVTDALYNLLLQQLVNQIGMALTGNMDQSGLLAALGVLLNPWATSEADAAIISINNFPKSVDFDLAVQDYFTGIEKFKYKFTGASVYDEKDILIKNFNGLFDIQKINVVKQGIIAGLVIDQLADGPWLLNGTFVDINDPTSFTNQTNRRFKSNYSLIDIGLKSYTLQTDGSHSLTLSVSLGSIPNLDGIVKGIPILGPILNTTINSLILDPLKTIIISTSINVPLLGISNLSVRGGWSIPAAY